MLIVGFQAGQPLGYRSSWPLFAFTHHVLVWWCAEQVYPGRRFTDYALLGDDIVIADKEVACVYERALSRLEVGISKRKSLISDRGAAEFAKRFLVKGLSKDLSPISAKAVLNSHHPYGRYAIAHRYTVKRFSTYQRLRYLQWYWTVGQDDWVSIETMLDAPPVDIDGIREPVSGSLLYGTETIFSLVPLFLLMQLYYRFALSSNLGSSIR